MTEPKEHIHNIKEKLNPKNVEPHYFFTIANVISLIRAFLALPIAMYLIRGKIQIALVLMSVAVVSDWLDGYAARKAQEVSTYGKALDPIADKLVGMAVLFVLVFQSEFPLWFVVMLTIRDFSITLLNTHLHNSRGLITGANIPGKIFISVATVVVFLWIFPSQRLIARNLLYLATFLMAFSWIAYIVQIRKLLRESPPAPVVTRKTEN